MKIKNYLVMLFLFVMSTALAQTQEVAGTVVDDQGLPLPGANVIIKGTTTGTLTDFDGKFAITASPGDVLVFSYVGFETIETVVGDKQDLIITLTPSAAALDEVVVVGYGTQKRSVVTGAISSVNASDLETLPINNVGDALQGRTSGLTVASSS